MTTATLDEIARLLSAFGAPGTFAARRTATADDLRLEVKGVGRLGFPISAPRRSAYAASVAPPATGGGSRRSSTAGYEMPGRFPKSRVKIDAGGGTGRCCPCSRRSAPISACPRPPARGRASRPAGLRPRPVLPAAPGLREDRRHGRHPGGDAARSFQGGAFVIEHKGKKVTCRGSKQLLSFIAFYADCHHEIRPVCRLPGRPDLRSDARGNEAAASPEAAPATVDALAAALREHFETPLPPRSARGGGRARTGAAEPAGLPPRPPVHRTWPRLASAQGGRRRAGGGLRAAAERAGCDTVLALAEVHETWSCEEEGWDDTLPLAAPPRGTTTRTTSGYEEDAPPADEPEAATSRSSSRTGRSPCALDRPAGKGAEPIFTEVRDEEVC